MALTATRRSAPTRAAPASGDVLFAGHTTWLRRGPAAWIPRRGWLLQYTVRGKREYVLRGARFSAAPGTLILLQRKSKPEPSAGSPTEPWECLSAFFELPEWSPPGSFRRLGDGIYGAEISLASTRQRVQDAFGRLMADSQARLADAAIALMDSNREPAEDRIRRELLLTNLREIFLCAEYEPRLVSRLDPRIRASLDVMGADLVAGHTVTSLGSRIGLSPSRFAHLFSSQVGVSPVRALRLMRLGQAALHLQYTDNSVQTVAEAAGFTSLTHLSREFRRHFGVSPRRYRANLGS